MTPRKSKKDSLNSSADSLELDMDRISVTLNEQFVVKVYAKVLCPDVEYKTLSVSKVTTCREMVTMLLNKFRMKHTDPNLFYFTMEITIRRTGTPIRTVIVLDDLSCPAQIQESYPHQDIKFSLVTRRGGLVKVYDSCLMSASLYKSLLISDYTNVAELIQLLLHCYDSDSLVSSFALYEVCPQKKWERRLHENELPLMIQKEWTSGEIYYFQLRLNYEEQIQRRKVNWIRSSTSSSSSQNTSFCYDFKDDSRPSSTSSSPVQMYNQYHIDTYFYV
ncbi:uncharacterized protein LOC128394944 [Panonychus citri]|uniref:uncharacterized protein LOC128394944 n=1 Tax=Panonychus citri TaxID=50023 RepID=UPI00230774A1|nr:uncharacterized protein LOC128394944 [Panonychus citri]